MSTAIPPTPKSRACVPAHTLAAFSEKVGHAAPEIRGTWAVGHPRGCCYFRSTDCTAPVGLLDFGLLYLGLLLLKMIKHKAGDMPQLKGSETAPRDINNCYHDGDRLERADLI